MTLDDPNLHDLEDLISDSFRVHENRDPVYVDVAGHLNRLAAKQHQIIFGRRGSGKSCLLVHFHRAIAPNLGILTIYLNADEVKQLRFPDVLIRTLIRLLDGLPGSTRSLWRRILRNETGLQKQIRELRELLDRADESAVVESVEQGSSDKFSSGLRSSAASLGSESVETAGRRTTSSFTQEKVDYLERHLQDFKNLISESLANDSHRYAAFMVDDFYLIRRSDQPDLVDYLHRLLRGTDCYLKVGTIRHRTNLMRYSDHTIGVELTQDVEAINLDRTLEDVGAAQDYLCGILNAMGKEVGIEDAVGEYLNGDAPLHLTLASGGVPRDFLNIFVEAVKDARGRGEARWITPRNVYRGARSSYRTKVENLRTDVGSDGAQPLERLFLDLFTFSLREKGKTAFLVAQSEIGDYKEEHDLIQQLMDLKLVHVVAPDTSAASGRGGRYEAYTLDAPSFMEPRLRSIEIVEFWKNDHQRRPVGLRESPVYPLDRARAVVAELGDERDLDSLVEDLREELGEEAAVPD